MKTIAIIGISGFLGRNLISTLLQDKSYRVRVLSRTGTFDPSVSKGLEVVRGDLLSLGSLQGLFEPGCIVINLAYLWGSGEGLNLLAMRNLVSECKRVGIQRMIHISTAAVSGRTGASNVDEQAMCSPIGEYGLVKLRIESFLRETCKHSFELAILRPTSIFGAGGEPLTKLAKDLLSGPRFSNYLKSCLFGTRRMNLVHLDNVLAAIIFLMNYKVNFSGDIFIVSDDDEDNNNFQYVEQFLMHSFGIPQYLIPPIHLPLVVLRLLLILLGRNNVNPCCNYNMEKLLNLGFRRPKTFESGLTEFVSNIQGLSAMKN